MFSNGFIWRITYQIPDMMLGYITKDCDIFHFLGW
jgi:hypothetical protein